MQYVHWRFIRTQDVKYLLPKTQNFGTVMHMIHVFWGQKFSDARPLCVCAVGLLAAIGRPALTQRLKRQLEAQGTTIASTVVVLLSSLAQLADAVRALVTARALRWGTPKRTGDMARCFCGPWLSC